MMMTMFAKSCFTEFMRWFASRAVPVLLIGSLVVPRGAWAEDSVSLDFVNTDIAAVAKAVGYITKRNFIMDPRVKGTVTIVSSRPVPQSEIYDVFLSALRTQGFTVVQGRGAYKIVPESEAKTNYTLTAGKGFKQGGESLITQVYPLQFADALQMMQVLRPLISPNNVVSALVVGNMLVITDYADNLKRLDLLIDAMDQPTGKDSAVLKLKYAVAGDVALALQKLVGEGKDEPSSQKLSVAVDSRTNTILLHSSNTSKIDQIRQLVAELDTPQSQNAAPRVIFLRNADASRLVQTLQGGTAGSGSPSSRTATQSAGSASAGLSTSAPASFSSSSTASASASVADGQLQILADSSLNAIILIGPAVLQEQYTQVVEKLDSRPAEVFIEALIVEMSADKAMELGIQWQFLNSPSGNSTKVIGGTNFGSNGTNIISASQDLTGVGKGLNLGLINGSVSIPINGMNFNILDLGALAHALESQGGTHILSAPNLLTMDNEEAQIVVGQNIPVVTGSYTLNGTGGSTSPFQTVQRQDVGLMLKVRPQISNDGSIRLKLYQEVSSVQGNSTTSSNGPTTNKRSIDTTVMVDDRHVVVLGGLMQDTFENGVEKIPLLGDLPVLGNLFQSKSRDQVKTDLFVFLRPVVVRDRQGLDHLTDQRYGYARDRFDGVDRKDMQLEKSAPSQLWMHMDGGLRNETATQPANQARTEEKAAN